MPVHVCHIAFKVALFRGKDICWTETPFSVDVRDSVVALVTQSWVPSRLHFLVLFLRTPNFHMNLDINVILVLQCITFPWLGSVLGPSAWDKRGPFKRARSFESDFSQNSLNQFNSRPLLGLRGPLSQVSFLIGRQRSVVLASMELFWHFLTAQRVKTLKSGQQIALLLPNRGSICCELFGI